MNTSNEHHLCPLCRGSGLNPHHPKIFDTPAGKYGNDMICQVCEGSGTDPVRHPDKLEAHPAVKEYREWKKGKKK